MYRKDIYLAFIRQISYAPRSMFRVILTCLRYHRGLEIIVHGWLLIMNCKMSNKWGIRLVVRRESSHSILSQATLADKCGIICVTRLIRKGDWNPGRNHNLYLSSISFEWNESFNYWSNKIKFLSIFLINCALLYPSIYDFESDFYNWDVYDMHISRNLHRTVSILSAYTLNNATLMRYIRTRVSHSTWLMD